MIFDFQIKVLRNKWFLKMRYYKYWLEDGKIFEGDYSLFLGFQELGFSSQFFWEVFGFFCLLWILNLLMIIGYQFVLD